MSAAYIRTITVEVPERLGDLLDAKLAEKHIEPGATLVLEDVQGTAVLWLIVRGPR